MAEAGHAWQAEVGHVRGVGLAWQGQGMHGVGYAGQAEEGLLWTAKPNGVGIDLT